MVVSHAGSARFALFLVCCSGTLLSSHMAPYTPGTDKQRAIIKELRSSFEKLLNDYQQEERGVPESSRYQMPCFTLSPQPPHNINSSAILPYFRAIEPFFDNKEHINNVLDHLSKLEFQHETGTKISVPTDSFECKRFIVSILKKFSECLKSDLLSKLFQ